MGSSCLSNSILDCTTGRTPMHNTNVSKMSTMYMCDAQPLNDRKQVLHAALSWPFRLFWSVRLYTIAYANIPFSILFAPGPWSSALISDGCTMAKSTMTKNMSNASKIYKYTSCEMRYPSLPVILQSAYIHIREIEHLLTLSVFDQAENATDPNKTAAGVQRVQTSLP